MKTITMDLKTYEDELLITKERLLEEFDKGAKANEKRIKPLLDYLRKVIFPNHVYCTKPPLVLEVLDYRKLKQLLDEIDEH